MPNRIESRNITTVTGSEAVPAASALQPATCWRNSTRKKNSSPRPPYIEKVSTLPIAKLRLRKSASGSIGCSLRASHTRKPANSSAPIASGRATAGSAQPRSGCSIRPKVIAASPSAHRSAPTTSTRASAGRSRPSGTARKTSTSVTITIGMLIAKIQRQEAASTSWPPISGPSTVPIPPQAVHAPTALPRSSGGKAVTITASAAGVSSAPATP